MDNKHDEHGARISSGVRFESLPASQTTATWFMEVGQGSVDGPVAFHSGADNHAEPSA